MRKKGETSNPPQELRRLSSGLFRVFQVQRAHQLNQIKRRTSHRAANCRFSVSASETYPHKLIAVKSSHLTRRGRYLAVKQSKQPEYVFPQRASVENGVRLDFTKKEGNILLVLIAKIPTALRMLLFQSSALHQWQLSHAVSRSQTNRNYSPAHKTTPDQSELPLHVGTRPGFSINQ